MDDGLDMDNSAAGAKIIELMKGVGKEDSDNWRLRMGTVQSINPLQVGVDGLSLSLTSAELVINEMMVRATGKVSGNASGSGLVTGAGDITSLSGDVAVTGTGSGMAIAEIEGEEVEVDVSANIEGSGAIQNASGQFSINSGDINGSIDISTALFSFDLKTGDRVVVAPIGSSRWVVLCKAVTI